MDVEKLLQQVKEGTVSIEQAQQALKSLPYEDLGFARIDHHRKLRTGFGEVIFCKGKTKEQVAVIFDRLAARDTSVLATKATKEQYEAVLAVCPQAEYQENGGLITLIREQPQYRGEVAVAEESAATAAFFGANVKRYYDVGVAGIHRLFDKLPEIERANVVIAVAGMEGALAGVLAGMIDKPVIAVPTSVGYGANFHGLSALLTMLNSCADGISVVNIDNGYGAGYLGAQINRLVTGKGEE